MAECNLAAELGMKCSVLTEAQRQVAELETLLAVDRQVLKSTRAEWAEREHKLHDQLKTASQTIATLEAKLCADRNKIANLEVKNADEIVDRNKIDNYLIAFLEEALANARLNESRCLRELGEKAEQISDLNADRAKLQEIANNAALDLTVARYAAEGWRARANGLGSERDVTLKDVTRLTCDLSAATAAVANLRKINDRLVVERDNAECLRDTAQRYSKTAFERGKELSRERDEARKSVVELDGKLREVSDRATVTLAERDEARQFGEAAAKKYNALLKDVDVVTCAFCGHEYPRGTPRHGDGQLVAHMKTCLKHPMREVEEKLRGLEHAYGELKTWNTVLEIKIAEEEKQLSYDAFLLEELRTQLDEKERVDKAGSTANKRLRDESDSLRNRISADAGRIKGLISLVNRLVARLPRVRIADNNAVLCAGCGAVFYRYGSTNLAESCKPDCIFTAAQKVLADCNAATPL